MAVAGVEVVGWRVARGAATVGMGVMGAVAGVRVDAGGWTQE